MIKNQVRRGLRWGVLLLALAALALGVAGGSLAVRPTGEFPWQGSQGTPNAVPWQGSQAPSSPGEWPWQGAQTPSAPGEFPWQL